MSKQVSRLTMRKMDIFLVGLLVAGLVIVFVAIQFYLIPNPLLSDDHGEAKIRSCFAEVDKILASHGIDMSTGTVEEGYLMSPDAFEMETTIKVDEHLELSISIYQVARMPCYSVKLCHYGEVTNANQYMELSEYPYVYEVAAYLGNFYSSESLLKSAEKRQKAAIEQRESDGQDVYESKQHKRFFIRMEMISFCYFDEASSHDAYQSVFITDGVRA